ncbi:MAG: D-xylose ABC transporter ATP-binding protein, partial [Lactococcus sp.]
ADKEVEILFKIIRKLQEDKVSIIYISHRLEEIFELSHRIAVMRDGKMITVLENKGITHDDLVEHMLGRKLDTMFPEKLKCDYSNEILRVDNLTNE